MLPNQPDCPLASLRYKGGVCFVMAPAFQELEPPKTPGAVQSVARPAAKRAQEGCRRPRLHQARRPRALVKHGCAPRDPAPAHEAPPARSTSALGVCWPPWYWLILSISQVRSCRADHVRLVRALSRLYHHRTDVRTGVRIPVATPPVAIGSPANTSLPSASRRPFATGSESRR